MGIFIDNALSRVVILLKPMLEGRVVALEKSRMRNLAINFVYSLHETMLLILPEATIYDKKFT